MFTTTTNTLYKFFKLLYQTAAVKEHLKRNFFKYDKIT